MTLKLAFAQPAFVTAESSPSLLPGDCRALRGLAAYQLRYGFVEEAVVVLLIGRRLWPRDIGTLLLLAQALLHAGHDSTAELILSEGEQHEASRRGSAAALLMHSVLLLRKFKVPEARRVFLQCLSRRRTGAV